MVVYGGKKREKNSSESLEATLRATYRETIITNLTNYFQKPRKKNQATNIRSKTSSFYNKQENAKTYTFTLESKHKTSKQERKKSMQRKPSLLVRSLEY